MLISLELVAQNHLHGSCGTGASLRANRLAEFAEGCRCIDVQICCSQTEVGVVKRIVSFSAERDRVLFRDPEFLH